MRASRATQLRFARGAAPLAGSPLPLACAPRGRLNTRQQLSDFLLKRKVSPATLVFVAPEIDAGVRRKSDLLWLAGLLEATQQGKRRKGVPTREVVLRDWPYIRDWITTTRTKLAGKSWTKALEQAKDWHKKLEATAGTRTSKSRSVVADLGDGWVIVEVPVSDYSAEGKEMGLCLRVGHRYGQQGYQTFSLRGPDNASHATMTIAPPGTVKGYDKAPVIVEIKGKKNRLPNRTYRELVMRWLKMKPWGVPFRVLNASKRGTWSVQDALGFSWALPDDLQRNNQFSPWGRFYPGKGKPKGKFVTVQWRQSDTLPPIPKYVMLPPDDFVDNLLEFLDPVDVAYLLGGGQQVQIRALLDHIVKDHPELIGGALMAFPIEHRIPWLDHSDPLVAAGAAWSIQRWAEAAVPTLQQVMDLRRIEGRHGLLEASRRAAHAWAMNSERSITDLEAGMGADDSVIRRAAGVGVDAWFQRAHSTFSQDPYGYYKTVGTNARKALSGLPINARSARLLARSPNVVDRAAATLFLPAKDLAPMMRDPVPAIGYLAVGRGTPKALLDFVRYMLPLRAEWTRGQRQNAGLAMFRLAPHLSPQQRRSFALASAEYGSSIAETGLLDTRTARELFAVFDHKLREEYGIGDDPDFYDDDQYDNVAAYASARISFLSSLRPSLKGSDLVAALDGILWAAYDLEIDDPWSEIALDGHLERAIRQAPEAVMNSGWLMSLGGGEIVVLLAEQAEGKPAMALDLIQSVHASGNEYVYHLYHDWIGTSIFTDWADEGSLTAERLVDEDDIPLEVAAMMRMYRLAYGDEAAAAWGGAYGYSRAHVENPTPGVTGNLPAHKFTELVDALDRYMEISSRIETAGQKLPKGGANLSSRGRSRRRAAGRAGGLRRRRRGRRCASARG